MTNEVTLLKELDEADQIKALKEVAFGKSRLLLLLSNERRYMFPGSSVHSIDHEIKQYEIKNHGNDGAGIWKEKVANGERIGVFRRKDVEPILKPYFCEPGFQVVESDKDIAIALVADLSDTDVFSPWSHLPSLGNHWRILSDITEPFETWEIYEDNEFTLQDLAVGQIIKSQRYDLIKRLMLRYLNESEKELWDLNVCIEGLLTHPDISDGENGSLCWVDDRGEGRESKRKTLQNRFNTYKNLVTKLG